jgi:hypothetical protein
MEEDGALEDGCTFRSGRAASVEESKRRFRGLVPRWKNVALKTGDVAQLVMLTTMGKTPCRAYVSPRRRCFNDEVLVDLLVDLVTELC